MRRVCLFAVLLAGAVLTARGDVPALSGSPGEAEVAPPRTPATVSRTDEDDRKLFDAVIHGRGEVVERLLAAGADPNVRNDNGLTVLGAAVSYGQTDVARLLVDSGADLHHRDSLMGWSYLHVAAEHAGVEMARFLLDAGIPVDVRSGDGWTPLYKAAADGRLAMVRFLVDAGADVAVGDDDGETPLDFAVSHAERARARGRAVPYSTAEKFEDVIAFLSTESFFKRVGALCGARFEGRSSFPEDPGDAFRGKTLVAVVESCGEEEVRIPFHVGEDASRTWILKRVDDGLELKHDHRHADGTPDEVTMYGGTTRAAGTALSQSFPADAYTAQLLPEAATNEWFLTLSEDGAQLTYYLERHGQPRFRATLRRMR